MLALEAGPRDRNKFIHIPAAFSKLFRSEVDWDYLTEPQPELDGRQIYWPRGKTLGGSSSMNAMMWVPGFPADYDEWGDHAGADWNYAGLEKYLKRIEAGPLVIEAQRSPRSSTAAWLAAATECGHDGFCETRVTQRRGARWSTADAYLKPALRRPNLDLLTEATATRIVFAGNRAVGVEFDKGGVRGCGDGTPRGHPVRRRDQLPAPADAVGNRRPGPAGAPRDRGDPARARCRHQSP